MQMKRNQLLIVVSEVLDRIEAEVFGVKPGHSKRIAFISMKLGQEYGMSQEQLSEITSGAFLHDNALKEYRENYINGKLRAGISGRSHCLAGEENLKYIPIYKSGKGYILYHHECADGSGPFGKTEEETPLGAQIIHIADELDLRFSLGSCKERSNEDIKDYLKKNEGVLFSAGLCRCLSNILDTGMRNKLEDKSIKRLVFEIPDQTVDFSNEQIYFLAGLFADVIDAKSSFTKTHSMEIAKRAAVMGRFYHYDQDTVSGLYLAGALHDIGKLVIDRDILEKPGSLNEKEYQDIQDHAYETWRILSRIEGLEEVTRWAALHHEKLDGSGYPFGLKADELGHKERLLACLDIYQALVEKRPYKEGMSHDKAVGILRDMAGNNKLDAGIVEDINQVFGEGKGV